MPKRDTWRGTPYTPHVGFYSFIENLPNWERRVKCANFFKKNIWINYKIHIFFFSFVFLSNVNL